MEALVGFEPTVGRLQLPVLPLHYSAIYNVSEDLHLTVSSYSSGGKTLEQPCTAVYS